MKVSLKLKEIRESKGLTQGDMCKMLNMLDSTYRNIEKERVKNFRIETLFLLKKVLNLSSVEDLFDVDYDD